MEKRNMAAGLTLLDGLFQISYVTADLETGLRALKDRFGIRDMMIMHDVDHGPATRSTVALGWAGKWLVELFEPHGDGSSLYEQISVPQGELFRLHHLGHRIDSEEAWMSLRDHATAGGQPILAERDAGAFRVMYLDTRPTLGHFTEHVFPNDAGRAFLDSIPRN
jgi:hypothetical protein